MSADRLSFASVRELGTLLRSREVSAVELATLSLERLDGLGRQLAAVVTVTDDVALAEARLADAELARGLDRGPLHGIPYGAKDILATAGIATTWGAAPFRDQVPTHDATVVRLLRDAGAVLTAKVATVEIAGGMGYNNPDASFTGPTVNPWNADAWVSGSSSGPAAAVAAGLVPFAIGSDTSGSIVLPAAWTGLAGLRATYGRVSRFGAMTLCWTLDRLGPMCRTAEDCSLVLEAISGHDPNDPGSVNQPPYRHASASRTGGFRFGVVRRGAEGAEPEIAEHYERTLGLLRELGTVEELDLPDLPYDAVADIVLGAEAAAAFDDFIAAGRTQELTASQAAGHRLDGLAIPAVDYIRGQRLRRKIATGFVGVASRFDALVAPTLGTTASGVREDFEYMLRSAFPVPLNVAGVLSGTPTISLPNGLGRNGLPTAVALAGPRLGEAGILAGAMALETRLGFTELRPPAPYGPAREAAPA
jgi:aspartyl-tRNA(Asn)/glutamyl-tRNA(Gln) amidotransferase subunit A